MQILKHLQNIIKIELSDLQRCLLDLNKSITRNIIFEHNSNTVLKNLLTEFYSKTYTELELLSLSFAIWLHFPPKHHLCNLHLPRTPKFSNS